MRRIIFPFLLLFSFGFSTCEVYSEIKGLKDGQEEIKRMLKKVLFRLQASNSSAPTSSPETDQGSSSFGTTKWFNSGCSVVSASKTTLGDNVRLQIEMSFSEPTTIYWGVDQRLIGANEKDFGTTMETLSNTTLFTLDAKKPVSFVILMIPSKDDMVTNIRFDTEGDDGKIKFDNPITCQSSFSKISDSEYDFFYRCNPELDPRNGWYMQVGMFASVRNELVEYNQIESKENKYVNVTTERNSTAKATVVLSDETLERVGDFLFLQSSLNIPMGSVISSILYRSFYDISITKTMNEFKFLEPFPQPPFLEGDMVPVNCEALGRNPPPIQVERNGAEISSSQTVYVFEDTTKFWSSSSVTFLHASKEIEGNYSCVIEKDGEKLISPMHVEVKLKPRLRWDLTKILKSKQNQTRVRVVVEGANGVTLDCSDNSWSGKENPPVHNEKRTKISEWNERLEVKYTWRKMNIIPDEFNYSSDSPSLSCIAKDKNGDLTFEHTFWQ
ncbi:uncharacterized protein LOC133205532 [Saccostrea echinata]|uniref:uncharacterized protein LOC133205532 n=1 Tax=Saccostrea echinata TaxID=191078 RepID=UPI002A8198A6|nr:uncharacterized protein LOC133205532 [Saccostrea echinata]